LCENDDNDPQNPGEALNTNFCKVITVSALYLTWCLRTSLIQPPTPQSAQA